MTQTVGSVIPRGIGAGDWPDWMPDQGCRIALGMEHLTTKKRTEGALEGAAYELINANRALPEIEHSIGAIFTDQHGKSHRLRLVYPATSDVFVG